MDMNNLEIALLNEMAEGMQSCQIKSLGSFQDMQPNVWPQFLSKIIPTGTSDTYADLVTVCCRSVGYINEHPFGSANRQAVNNVQDAH